MIDFQISSAIYFLEKIPILKNITIFGKLYYFCSSFLKLRVMTKRGFYAIVLVAIGLFITLNLGTFAIGTDSNSQTTEVGGGGNSANDVNGVYVPD